MKFETEIIDGFNGSQTYNAGHKHLYDKGSHLWGTINKKAFELMTYTEGDVTLIKCNSKEGLVRELRLMLGFWNEYDTHVANQIMANSGVKI